MKTRADAVIIGGGIVGTSIAYHLALRGMHDIVLLEMDMVGSGSSGRSAAMVLLQMSREMTIRMSQESLKKYLRFQDELGVDIGYRPIGYINLATAEIADELRRQVNLQHQFGVPTRVLKPSEITRLVPAVNVDDIVFGAVCWQDGSIDPHSVMQGYVQNARRKGVEVVEKAEATGICVEKGRVTAVHTPLGPIATPLVINAAGARAPQVGAWVGLDLPIKNYKRHIFITERFDEIAENSPFIMDLAVEWYFRKEGKGVLMGMGVEESTNFEPQFEWEFLEILIQHALRRTPILANARIMRGWAGLRPLTPDDYPILGPVPGVSGFVNACGWGGHGVMHAPIAGQLIAEYVTEGATRILPLEPFLLTRFERENAPE